MEHSDPARKLSAKLYDMPLLCVYSKKTPDDGQRNCSKHVEFHSKNKFEKLVHLGGFIIQTYHDERSHERRIKKERLFTSFSRILVHGASILWADEHTTGLQPSIQP